MITSNTNYHILVNKKSGQMLKFYISDKTIYYIVFDNNNSNKKVKLIDDIKNYDITLDSNDNIHLLCTTHEGKLWYLCYSNYKWNKKFLKEFDPVSKNIDHLNIISLKNTIHIFYSFIVDSKKKKLKLFHLYKINSMWKYNYLSTITFKKGSKPYYVDFSNNGNIYLIYKTLNINSHIVYMRTFSHANYRWSTVKTIDFPNDNIDVVNFFIDLEDNIHFIYELNGEGISLYHAYQKFSELGKQNLSNSFITSKDDINIQHHMLQRGENIWILWKANNVLYSCHSKDHGQTWSKKEIVGQHDSYSIKYIGSKYKDFVLSKPITTFSIVKNKSTYLLAIDDNLFIEKDIESVNIKEINDNKFKEFGEIEGIDDTTEEIWKENDMDRCKEDKKIINQEYCTNNCSHSQIPQSKEISDNSNLEISPKKKLVEKLIDFLTSK